MDSLRSYTHLMSLHLWKRRTLLRMFQHLPLNKAKLFLSQHPHFSLHPIITYPNNEHTNLVPFTLNNSYFNVHQSVTGIHRPHNKHFVHHHNNRVKRVFVVSHFLQHIFSIHLQAWHIYIARKITCVAPWRTVRIGLGKLSICSQSQTQLTVTTASGKASHLRWDRAKWRSKVFEMRRCLSARTIDIMNIHDVYGEDTVVVVVAQVI